MSQDEHHISHVVSSLLDIVPRSPLTKEEEKLTQAGKLVEVIYNRVTSTKFRKSSIDEGTVNFYKKYLQKAIENNERIRLYFLFGGYKQARLSNAPYPDWAEVFNINLALKAATSIESIYDSGVDVIYRGDEVVTTLIGNYKVSARKAYAKRLNEIMALFNQHIPHNRSINVRYELTSETSPEEKLFKLMDELYPKYKKTFDSLSQEVQEQRIQKSYRNQCWDGEKDLTSLSEEERLTKVKWASIMHDVFLEADVKLAEEYFNNGISISFRKGIPGCIHYGSCSSSTVQFWAGEGFLEMRDDRIVPWILSYEQQQKISPKEIVLGDENEFKKVGLNKIRIFGK